MKVLEFKVKGKLNQFQAIDEAIKTAQFVRNKCVRHWMDNRGIGQKELYRYNTSLRSEFPFVKALNSHACQASVERAYASIARSGLTQRRLKIKQITSVAIVELIEA